MIQTLKLALVICFLFTVSQTSAQKEFTAASRLSNYLTIDHLSLLVEPAKLFL
jgi:hypothetical protein